MNSEGHWHLILICAISKHIHCAGLEEAIRSSTAHIDLLLSLLKTGRDSKHSLKPGSQ